MSDYFVPPSDIVDGTTAEASDINNLTATITTAFNQIEAEVDIHTSYLTVANEASDTTCFVPFLNNATGLGTFKTNANLTFNSSTGVLTATGFTTSAGIILGGVDASVGYNLISNSEAGDSICISGGLDDSAIGASLVLRGGSGLGQGDFFFYSGGTNLGDSDLVLHFDRSDKELDLWYASQLRLLESNLRIDGDEAGGYAACVYIKTSTAGPSLLGTHGSVWVKDTGNGELWFTDTAGVSTKIV